MSQKEAHGFFFVLFVFLVRSECQSCKLFLVVSIFAGLHFRFVCSSGFFAWQWFSSFPAKKIKSEWITGEFMWACHSSSHDGSLKAGWRDVLRFLFLFFPQFKHRTMTGLPRLHFTATALALEWSFSLPSARAHARTDGTFWLRRVSLIKGLIAH